MPIGRRPGLDALNLVCVRRIGDYLSRFRNAPEQSSRLGFPRAHWVVSGSRDVLGQLRPALHLHAQLNSALAKEVSVRVALYFFGSEYVPSHFFVLCIRLAIGLSALVDRLAPSSFSGAASIGASIRVGVRPTA